MLLSLIVEIGTIYNLLHSAKKLTQKSWKDKQKNMDIQDDYTVSLHVFENVLSIKTWSMHGYSVKN